MKIELKEIVRDTQHQYSVELRDLKDFEATEPGKKEGDLQVFTIKGPWRHEVQVVKNEALSTGLGHSLCPVRILMVHRKIDGVARRLSVQVAHSVVIITLKDGVEVVDQETVGMRQKSCVHGV